jgi:transketolase
LTLTPGKSTTLRGALGAGLGYLNHLTNGAFLGCAADLLDSTSVSGVGAGFPKGFYHDRTNPGSRLEAVGGICEDAMGAMMSGASSFGRHVGVTSSYASFIAALEHIAARLHGIGQQARHAVSGEPPRTWIMVNAHVGSMTGEDGPTHADPQALQLLEGNFPDGTLITLTPWEPQEVWPLLIAGLMARPAVLAPFVTRPPVPVPDRKALNFPPAAAAARGVYAMRRSAGKATIVLQGCGVTTLFVRDVLPRLDAEGLAVNVFYVASAELFDRLTEAEREAIFPVELTYHSLGVTDFTLPTLRRWVRSEEGLRRSLHPYRNGHFLGSGIWENVMKEGGLDGASQLAAVRDWCKSVR